MPHLKSTLVHLETALSIWRVGRPPTLVHVERVGGPPTLVQDCLVHFGGLTKGWWAGLGFRVQGLGFRVLGSGFRVQV